MTSNTSKLQFIHSCVRKPPLVFIASQYLNHMHSDKGKAGLQGPLTWKKQRHQKDHVRRSAVTVPRQSSVTSGQKHFQKLRWRKCSLRCAICQERGIFSLSVHVLYSEGLHSLLRSSPFSSSPVSAWQKLPPGGFGQETQSSHASPPSQNVSWGDSDRQHIISTQVHGAKPHLPARASSVSWEPQAEALWQHVLSTQVHMAGV